MICKRAFQIRCEMVREHGAKAVLKMCFLLFYFFFFFLMKDSSKDGQFYYS